MNVTNSNPPLALLLQFISFPECIGHLFEDCLDLINADLTNLGMSTVEIVVHEKRNINQDVSYHCCH